MLGDALKKHGTAADVILNERFEEWPIAQTMRLFVMLAKDMARAETERRAASLEVTGFTSDRKCHLRKDMIIGIGEPIKRDHSYGKDGLIKAGATLLYVEHYGHFQIKEKPSEIAGLLGWQI